MRRAFFLAVVLAATTSAAVAQRLLIVHADDLGMAHSVNAASTDAFATGLVSSGSIIVTCPWFPEAAAYARAHPGADLGLHLTLTSEWTGFKWGPLSANRSLTDNSGYFYPTEAEAAARIDPKQAEAEIRAQIARARSFGIEPTHLDSHMGTLYQNAALFEVFLRVARDNHIPARISKAHAAVPFRAALLKSDDIVIDRIVSIEADVPPEKWVAYYSEKLEHLEPGVTEFVIHLAYDDPEMRAMTADHPNWGAAWRQRDFDFFTSDTFRQLLRKYDIQLVTWRSVNKR